MNFRVSDWRERRSILNNRNLTFIPMQFNLANYSTDVRMEKKSDLETFNEEILTKISSIPDPLKKNLADTVITCDNNKETRKMPAEVSSINFNHIPEEKGSPTHNRSDFYQSITGITSFFTSVFGAISGAVFQRRPKSPASQYFDCYDSDSEIVHQMAPGSWQEASTGDQNKKRAPESFSADTNDNMNNCRAAVAQCEDKLNVVRSLLTTKTVPTTPKLRRRRPRRVFVEPNSVEDSYEDEFISDQYTSLANEEYIEYFSRPSNQTQVLNEIDAAKMKTEFKPMPETTDIVKVLPEMTNKVPVDVIEVLPEVNKELVIEKQPETQVKREVISSCEDKMAKLKSLLREKCQKSKLNDSTDSLMEQVKEERPKKPPKVIPIEKKQDKKFKNPCRRSDRPNKSKMKKSIQDDMIFANEIDSEDISSTDNSPVTDFNLKHVAENIQIGSVESVDYFDELKGRFHSASTTESEDSFQIVFTDSPRPSRICRPSECDSEDSFIIFEDSPDSCYTSNDVFNDSDIESEAGSDVSDSGCAFDVCRLSHTFSRTVSDLTDDSLYEDTVSKSDTKIPQLDSVNSQIDGAVTDIQSVVEQDSLNANDEVDCAVRTFEDVQSAELSVDVKPSLLIDDNKKLLRKNLPPKKVTFSEKPPKVRVMRVWAFAARQARAGHWERHALDRERFKRRIADVDMAVSWVLKPQHRSRVMFQRFMPWWNQQKRREAAERKQKAEEDKRKQEEEERRRQEEEERRTVEEEENEKRSVEEDEDREKEQNRREDAVVDAKGKTVVEGSNKVENARMEAKDDVNKTVIEKMEKVKLNKDNEIEKVGDDNRNVKGYKGSKDCVKLVDTRKTRIVKKIQEDKLADLNSDLIVKENIAT